MEIIGVEGAIRKREARGVGLREIQRGIGGAVEIGADGDEWAELGREAAGARSDVEHALAGAQVAQDFVHVLFLSGKTGETMSIFQVPNRTAK